MPIKILENSLINKIAAGEVIERPSSVIKELLENSIDANSDEITIEIEDAGLKKIKIIDNGKGMSRSDLLLSYKRHATSKINNEEDLFNIHSLGFRGEALASIAEISNIKIKTKREEDSVGNYIEVEAGEVKEEKVVASSNGTTIEITDLFFNVPIRKKYLKSFETEFNYILQIISKYTLIHEDKSFKLIKDGKEILNSRKSDMLLDKIISIYGTGIAKELIPIKHEENEIKIFGYISKPHLTRSDKTDQSIYVNKRYIKNPTISNAIYEACKGLIFTGRHPLFVLNIKIDPTEIDVNVHPSKKLIRLKNETTVFETIFNSIKNAFKNISLIENVNLENNTTYKKPTKEYSFSKDQQTTLQIKENPTETIYPKKIETQPETKKIGPFKILGQINKTFIVTETPEGLTIIDQHAAEERVNYEKFLQEKKENAIRKQNLVIPKILELNPFQYRVATNNKNFLNNIGYEFEEFGENSIKLSSIPEIFGRLKSVLFIDIINELEKNTIITQEIEERIIRFSCRASIKAGDELTTFQINQLLDKLEKCDNPFTCPHGRPTIINFSTSDLEKKFKRTGW